VQIIDLYSGIGGFSLAGDWMGWRTIQFCEINVYCIKILKKHWPEIPIHRNIKTLTASTVIQNKLYDKNQISIVTGGVPCQPWSSAGKRKGEEDVRNLWPETIEFVGTYKPEWFVFENVIGFVNWNEGMVFKQTISDLESKDYEVLPIVLPACGIGAWHKRDRIWLIGKNKNHTSYSYSDSNRFYRTKVNQYGWTKQGRTELFDKQISKLKSIRSVLGNSPNQGLQEWKEDQFSQSVFHAERASPSGERQWNAEPNVGRVADGIPNRVDRIKALGNAVVPQLVVMIYKAIEEYYHVR
jgi:DNA (cytosine-5)-methyltransferase 1